MEFKQFTEDLVNHFSQMIKGQTRLYLTDVDKELIWDAYLNSFPEGDERQSFNCNSCRQFLRPYGNLVIIKNNKLISIWDFAGKGEYKTVCENLSKLVKSKPICDVFVTKFSNLGTEYNYEQVLNSAPRKWNHIHLNVPSSFMFTSKDSVDSIMGDQRSTKQVFKRSLEELTLESSEIVLDLINQGSLYRGDEFKPMILAFKKLKQDYDKLPEDEKDNYCWFNYSNQGTSVSKIRNTAIGTLLVDLSEGKDIDKAVSSFEKVVAPANYKRPKAIVTKSMIEDAQKKVSELGLENSLARRHSTIDDITVNNVIFANRDSKKSISSSVFDSLKDDLPINPKKFNKITEVSIEEFIKNIVPTSSSIELLFESSLLGNLMTLTSPENKDSLSLFKWNNGFSWSYKGDVTDSIKDKIKAKGGTVIGELRCSLHWFNLDDLDIHVVEPDGNRIHYASKVSSRTGGFLDVDMNANTADETRTSRDAVENIVWTDKSRMQEGKYILQVHNFTKRETTNVGFECEVEHDGIIHKFEYATEVRQKEYVTVAEFEYNRKTGLKFIKSLKDVGSVNSVDEWGIGTNKFHKVSLMMLSPNHWDNQSIGNKHYFFILEGCKNPDSVRGFYNEYLSDNLTPQKKVFELLGGRMKINYSDNQLSGLGFSSTVRNSVICNVKGSFDRTIKINF